MFNSTFNDNKILLNSILENKSNFTKDDFDFLVSLCYGMVLEDEINNSVNDYILPMYDKINNIVKSMYVK